MIDLRDDVLNGQIGVDVEGFETAKGGHGIWAVASARCVDANAVYQLIGAVQYFRDRALKAEKAVEQGRSWGFERIKPKDQV